MKWLVAAALLLAGLGAGLFMARGTAPAVATHVLLLYGDTTTTDSLRASKEREALQQWVDGLRARGVAREAQALGAGGIALFKPDTTAFGGVAADVMDPRNGDLAGWVLVTAGDRQAAMRLARDCPLLARGGRVVVRALDASTTRR